MLRISAATASTAIALGPATYLTILTAAGASPARRRALQEPVTRFAIMVPAHDEESVIADALESFRLLDYPADMFEVHVVADNCNDCTAEIVRGSGFVVHERHAPHDPGKGPALNWLFDRLDGDMPGRFDATVVVDADSVVDRGFLRAMDSSLSGGSRAAQGLYLVRHPGDSLNAGLRYAALACRHHLRPLGRCRLRASAGLYGNGMAFEWSLLRSHRWTGHLVEDAELHMELLLEDALAVTYVPDARIAAEMPATLEAAVSQNARWERGRIEVARRYTPALARRLVRGGTGRRVAYVDAIADTLLPPLSVVALLHVTGLMTEALVACTGRRSARRRMALHAAGAAVVMLHVLTGLLSVGAPGSAYRALLRAPRMAVWKIRLWAQALVGGREVAWTRTQRNAERGTNTR